MASLESGSAVTDCSEIAGQESATPGNGCACRDGELRMKIVALSASNAAADVGTRTRHNNQLARDPLDSDSARTRRATFRAKNGEILGPLARPRRSHNCGSSSRFILAELN